MSSTLTENVVLVRTRSHDLNSVKKLNCWGCTLKDVSIVNRMPNVEVISLSINSIDTLQYFSSCTMLQELYLRKNEIKDINEILHLSQLQFLKKLSLEDNPCANIENYRLTVLKALPNLEFLDNIKVTAEELYQAEKLGRELVWPGTGNDEIEENNDLNTPGDDFSQNYDASIPIHEPHYMQVNSNNVSMPNGGLSALAPEYQSKTVYNGQLSNSASDPNNSGNTSSTTLHCPLNGNRNHNNSSQGNNYPITNQQITQKIDSPNSHSKKTNSLSDYNIYNTNGNFHCSSPALSGNTNEPMNEYTYENGPTINNTSQTYYMPNHFRSSNSNRANLQSASSSTTQQRILPKGGKNRNANILSAVLCLIKELDYGSLEVVDTTIHCRMEEMED